MYFDHFLDSNSPMQAETVVVFRKNPPPVPGEERFTFSGDEISAGFQIIKDAGVSRLQLMNGRVIEGYSVGINTPRGGYIVHGDARHIGALSF